MTENERHPATVQLFSFFDYSHLANQELQAVSAACGEMARQMIAALPDSAELTAGLRKLLEAKDCFVRAMVAAQREEAATMKTWGAP